MRWFGVSASTLTGVRATRLQDEGAESFVKSWKDLMAVISSKRAALTASGKA